MTTTIHREDVKATIRKRYGTIDAFQAAHHLSGQAVRDLLRGKSSTAKKAVAKLLGVNPDHLVITTSKVPVCGTDSSDARGTHCLSEVAK